ncbi:MAG: TlpA disulfide reductase family protein [Myxococcota bacterium]|nr:TlpA disulfide reductase family protein [Myxococcota bacterium]
MMIGSLSPISSRGFTALLCLSLVMLSGCLSAGESKALGEAGPRESYPTEQIGVEVNDTLEDLSFVNPDGSPFSLSEIFMDTQSRLLLITTSAEWCSACIKEQPVLQSLYEEYREAGLEILVVLFEDVNEVPAEPRNAAAWKQKYDLDYPVVADPTSPSHFSRYYDTRLTPMVMFVEVDDMKIIDLRQGFSESDVRSIIRTKLGL